jgi:hypothetical protein
MAVRIVAYTFEADIHCPACTAERADVGLLTCEPPLRQPVDEHGLTADLVDREGNPIRPVFSTDAFGVVVPHCSECGAPLE